MFILILKQYILVIRLFTNASTLTLIVGLFYMNLNVISQNKHEI